MNWHRIKRLEGVGGLRRADIEANDYGQFRFTEDSYVTEDGYCFWTLRGFPAFTIRLR